MDSQSLSTRVRRLAALKRSSERDASSVFLMEGPQGLKVLAGHPKRANEVWITAEALERYAEEVAALEAVDVPIIECSAEDIDKMTSTQHPQGVLAVVSKADVDLLPADLKLGLAVMLVAASDPGNVGTVIRTADAAGAQLVILTEGSVDLYNPKLVRSTAGSILNVTLLADVDFYSAVRMLRERDVQLVGTALDGDPLTGRESWLADPVCWVLGNEAHGLGEAELDAVDRVAQIPIFGAAESLNMASAAAICLYQSALARAEHGIAAAKAK
jgi:TrmH family RNA methyltransferase